ncbi:YihY/virulence factor BrkB family protein, partial [Nonlabens ulvanivorans]
RDGRQSRFFSIGATVTTILIVLLSVLYGIYIDNFTSYNEIYGSIGALLILMIYIWLNSNILLLGFELNASLRKLKAQNLNT